MKDNNNSSFSSTIRRSLRLGRKDPNTSQPTALRSCELICEGRSLWVNPGYICEFSKYFTEIIYEGGTQAKSVAINGVKFEQFLELLRVLCYCPTRKPITEANIAIIIDMACNFEVEPVMRRCEEFVARRIGQLDRQRLFQLTKTLSQCDRYNSTMTLLVDKMARMPDHDLSTMQFSQIPGDVVADLYEVRRLQQKRGTKRDGNKFCCLIAKMNSSQKSQTGDESRYTGIKFCSDCNNMLYPREDKAARTLMYACRSCDYIEESDNSCIYFNQTSVWLPFLGTFDGSPSLTIFASYNLQYLLRVVITGLMTWHWFTHPSSSICVCNFTRTDCGSYYMPLSTLRRQRLAESPYHPQESSKNKRAKLVSELPQSDKEKVNNAIDLALETLKEIGNFKYPLNGHHVDRCLSFLCETLHVLAKLWSDENSREFVEEATLERRIPYAVFKKAQRKRELLVMEAVEAAMLELPHLIKESLCEKLRDASWFLHARKYPETWKHPEERGKNEEESAMFRNFLDAFFLLSSNIDDIEEFIRNNLKQTFALSFIATCAYNKTSNLLQLSLVIKGIDRQTDKPKYIFADGNVFDDVDDFFDRSYSTEDCWLAFYQKENDSKKHFAASGSRENIELRKLSKSPGKSNFADIVYNNERWQEKKQDYEYDLNVLLSEQSGSSEKTCEVIDDASVICFKENGSVESNCRNKISIEALFEKAVRRKTTLQNKPSPVINNNIPDVCHHVLKKYTDFNVFSVEQRLYKMRIPCAAINTLYDKVKRVVLKMEPTMFYIYQNLLNHVLSQAEATILCELNKGHPAIHKFDIETELQQIKASNRRFKIAYERCSSAWENKKLMEFMNNENGTCQFVDQRSQCVALWSLCFTAVKNKGMGNTEFPHALVNETLKEHIQFLQETVIPSEMIETPSYDRYMELPSKRGYRRRCYYDEVRYIIIEYMQRMPPDVENETKEDVCSRMDTSTLHQDMKPELQLGDCVNRYQGIRQLIEVLRPLADKGKIFFENPESAIFHALKHGEYTFNGTEKTIFTATSDGEVQTIADAYFRKVFNDITAVFSRNTWYRSSFYNVLNGDVHLSLSRSENSFPNVVIACGRTCAYVKTNVSIKWKRSTHTEMKFNCTNLSDTNIQWFKIVNQFYFLQLHMPKPIYSLKGVDHNFPDSAAHFPQKIYHKVLEHDRKRSAATLSELQQTLNGTVNFIGFTWNIVKFECLQAAQQFEEFFQKDEANYIRIPAPHSVYLIYSCCDISMSKDDKLWVDRQLQTLSKTRQHLSYLQKIPQQDIKLHFFINPSDYCFCKHVPIKELTVVSFTADKFSCIGASAVSLAC
ncbi:hypothetical protein QR680_011617 [Steinernema hermaphroditum]|uniref:DNA-directed RNA polymerase II subunit RPB9-like zinc ribbon domain-containing protein n=1 Tax=Steinernema hermaphroditum TaxID=289476 RepID=A0AA39HZ41_9BILA|nr:hypothetical protein QR680_011617 [Steinernema hermaphroditum]